MGAAFQCDLCHHYESGEPVSGITFSFMDADGKKKLQTREVCTACQISLRDWQETRKPSSGGGAT